MSKTLNPDEEAMLVAHLKSLTPQQLATTLFFMDFYANDVAPVKRPSQKLMLTLVDAGLVTGVVVSEMIKLENPHMDDIVIEFLPALKIGPDVLTTFWAKLLGSKDLSTRESAALHLQGHADAIQLAKGKVPAYLDALMHSDAYYGARVSRVVHDLRHRGGTTPTVALLKGFIPTLPDDYELDQPAA